MLKRELQTSDTVPGKNLKAHSQKPLIFLTRIAKKAKGFEGSIRTLGLGPPDVISHDAGTNFTAGEFKTEARMMGIACHEVPVEALTIFWL